MASELMAIENEPQPINAGLPRKPRILLAASGSVAAMKFANLCRTFAEWAEIKAVATKASLHFIDKASLPNGLVLYTDEDEWSSWKQIGDSVLHIELRRWADIMVIAPLSANTLAKISMGLCDNLLTCIVRAWDYKKGLFVAPAMDTLMWTNSFMEKHLTDVDDLGIVLIPPDTERSVCGERGKGAMAEPSDIDTAIRVFLEPPSSDSGSSNGMEEQS
uniref:phosphopantothenoylcysteine decarboxylase n=1 Tax=Cannabis sativa TaxID=3483 RepID=A0A803P8M6_CANSA